MTISNEQEENISKVFEAANASLEIMKKGIRDGAERIKRLMEAGFHIERFMVNAQLVEHAAKNILHACRLKREVADILGLPDPYAHVGRDKKEQEWFEDSFRKFSRSSLGIVTRLVRMTTNENGLVEKLEEFNTFRQEFIHQTFNGTNEMADMDKKADDYLTHDNSLFEMVMESQALHFKIQQEISALYQSKKVHSAGVEPAKPEEKAA